MTLKEFLTAYAENMHQHMKDGGYSLSAMRINCDACPFQKLCEESDEPGLSCERFILNRLSDGESVRAE